MDPETVQASSRRPTYGPRWARAIRLSGWRRYPEVGALARFLAVFIGFSVAAP